MDSMDDNAETSLADLFVAYRQTTSEDARDALAHRIFETIYPPLSLFITRRRVDADKVDDVLQEALVGIFTSILVFRGKTHKSAWGFCYRIAFNKAMNSIRASTTNKEDTVPEEMFWKAIEASAEDRPFAVGERLDLELVMDLLRVSKPPCVHYLLLRYVDGLTYEEIGEVFDEDAETAGVTGRRCLARAQELAAQLKSSRKLSQHG